jgi:hypothetical protein
MQNLSLKESCELGSSSSQSCSDKGYIPKKRDRWMDITAVLELSDITVPPL